MKLFGEILEDFSMTIHSVSWKDSNRLGASASVGLYSTPTIKHAKFLVLDLVTDGFSSTIWPKPAFPKVTGPEAEFYGDEAYLFRGKSEYSLRARVGTSVISIGFSNQFLGPKQPRVPIEPHVYAQWDQYVKDLIKRIRKAQQPTR